MNIAQPDGRRTERRGPGACEAVAVHCTAGLQAIKEVCRDRPLQSDQTLRCALGEADRAATITGS